MQFNLMWASNAEEPRVEEVATLEEFVDLVENAGGSVVLDFNHGTPFDILVYDDYIE